MRKNRLRTHDTESKENLAKNSRYPEFIRGGGNVLKIMVLEITKAS
jgi:hypothetical protein